jgi:hypothetical protein
MEIECSPRPPSFFEPLRYAAPVMLFALLPGLMACQSLGPSEAAAEEDVPVAEAVIDREIGAGGANGLRASPGLPAISPATPSTASGRATTPSRRWCGCGISISLLNQNQILLTDVYKKGEGAHAPSPLDLVRSITCRPL